MTRRQQPLARLAPLSRRSLQRLLISIVLLSTKLVGFHKEAMAADAMPVLEIADLLVNPSSYRDIPVVVQGDLYCPDARYCSLRGRLDFGIVDVDVDLLVPAEKHKWIVKCHEVACFVIVDGRFEYGEVAAYSIWEKNKW